MAIIELPGDSKHFLKDSYAATLDINGAEHVEINISADGKVLWVNTKFGCKLRICNIGRISIRDFRQPSANYPRDQFDFIPPGAHITFSNCNAKQAANTIRARFPRWKAKQFTCRTINSVCHVWRRATLTE